MLQPLKKQLQSPFAFVDIAQLKSNIAELINRANECFSVAPDTIGWELIAKDGKQSGEKEISELDDILDLYDGQSGCVYCSTYKKHVTKEYRLRLTTDEYVSLRIDFEDKELFFQVGVVGEQNVIDLFETAVKGIAMIGACLPHQHKYLEGYLRQFHFDHSNYEKNVFLVMRFQDQPPFPDIVDAIRDECAKHGLNVLRADDKEYTDDLWDNVLTYLYGCASAIAVFDQINYREFNPNVALEVGFLFAQCKKVLLLKDGAIPTMPTDIVGKIYRSFNTYEPKQTIPPQIKRWIINYDMGK